MLAARLLKRSSGTTHIQAIDMRTLVLAQEGRYRSLQTPFRVRGVSVPSEEALRMSCLRAGARAAAALLVTSEQPQVSQLPTSLPAAERGGMVMERPAQCTSRMAIIRTVPY